MEKVPVKVVFRIDRKGVVFALFPYEPESRHLVMCYQHVGQHTSADYRGCIKASRPAKPGEYEGLHRELMARGYELTVIQRANARLMARSLM